jgi:hypothetical protein
MSDDSSIDTNRYGPFKNAVELIFKTDGQPPCDVIAAALENEGFDKRLALITASAMIAAANAMAAWCRPKLEELLADVDQLTTQNENLSRYAQRRGEYAEDLEDIVAEYAPPGILNQFDHWPPVVRTRCTDCEVGTITIGERFMVKDEVWEDAWDVWAERNKMWARRVPGQMVLCVGCLEARLGRELCATDFTDVPLNNSDEYERSARLLDRLRRPSARIGEPPPDPPPSPPRPPRSKKKTAGRKARSRLEARRVKRRAGKENPPTMPSKTS